MSTPKLNLDDVQRFALMKLRRNVSDVMKPHHNDYFLVRWLRARNWNVEAAEKMLRESLQWRMFWDVDGGLKNWEPPEALGIYYPSGSTGCEAAGAPVIFVPFAGFDIVGILHSATKQDVIKLVIKILEHYLDVAANTGAHQLVVVFDMDDFNLKSYAWRPAAETVISLIKMYEANYPEILKACYIINAPTVFAVAFSVVRRFLNEYTLSKIHIFKADPKKWTKVLREHIPPNILPKYFGGELLDANGDPRCSAMIRQGGKIPKSYYKNTYNDTTSEEAANFLTTVIKKGRKFTLDFIVASEGCVLRWEFRTEGHDIRFGITHTDHEGNNSPVIRFHRVASHQINESGVIACQAPATYTVVFDNSYSLLRSKKLHYMVSVIDPLTKLDISVDENDTLKSNDVVKQNGTPTISTTN